MVNCARVECVSQEPVLIADLCCVSGHRCPGLGSMAWIPSVGLERGEVMLTTEYHRYDENPRDD